MATPKIPGDQPIDDDELAAEVSSHRRRHARRRNRRQHQKIPKKSSPPTPSTQKTIARISPPTEKSTNQPTGESKPKESPPANKFQFPAFYVERQFHVGWPTLAGFARVRNRPASTNQSVPRVIPASYCHSEQNHLRPEQADKSKPVIPTGAGRRLFFSFAPANGSVREAEGSLFRLAEAPPNLTVRFLRNPFTIDAATKILNHRTTQKNARTPAKNHRPRRHRLSPPRRTTHRQRTSPRQRPGHHRTRLQSRCQRRSHRSRGQS